MREPKEEKKESNKFVEFLKEYVPYLVILILVLLFKRYVATPIKVNGDSMVDTLRDGDIMILNIAGKHFSKYERFDIVVVNTKEELIVKRVIGLPGEKIEYKDQLLYVNGKKVKDKYGSLETDDFTVKVPKGYYFVLGDNRGNSLDSRYYGAFPEERIMGTTSFTIFPFGRVGKKE